MQISGNTISFYFIHENSRLTTWYARAMTHDENKYQNPYEFKPERFLDADGSLNNDDRILSYGFGRRSVYSISIKYKHKADEAIRICVGKHLASTSVRLMRGVDRLMIGFRS